MNIFRLTIFFLLIQTIAVFGQPKAVFGQPKFDFVTARSNYLVEKIMNPIKIFSHNKLINPNKLDIKIDGGIIRKTDTCIWVTMTKWLATITISNKRHKVITRKTFYARMLPFPFLVGPTKVPCDTIVVYKDNEASKILHDLYKSSKSDTILRYYSASGNFTGYRESWILCWRTNGKSFFKKIGLKKGRSKYTSSSNLDKKLKQHLECLFDQKMFEKTFEIDTQSIYYLDDAWNYTTVELKMGEDCLHFDDKDKDGGYYIVDGLQKLNQMIYRDPFFRHIQWIKRHK